MHGGTFREIFSAKVRIESLDFTSNSHYNMGVSVSKKCQIYYGGKK
jgi:hypothetical protein